MKAIVTAEYGTPDVMRLQEVEKPTPKAGEVLVKVHAVSVNKREWIMLTGEPLITRAVMGALQKPKYPIIGGDIAGTVEAVGSGATKFKVGDEVFGDTADFGFGGFAEYVAVTEKALTLKPAGITFEQAAAIPTAGYTALQALRDKGQVKAGQKVLVNGASGGVGMFTVQIAKFYGADVTAVCSTKNIEMARSLGADRVIDYTKQDVTKLGEQYDLIIAANGYHSILGYRRILSPNGIYVSTGGTMGQIFEGMLLGPLVTLGSGKTMGALAAKAKPEDSAFVGSLVETGKVKIVIDRCYPLSETAEAMRYLGEVHPSGKVVVTV